MLKNTITKFLLPLLLAPSLGYAACNGQDLRQSMAAELRQSVTSEVAAIPFAEGNFYRAQRGERILNLIGTVHINDARLDPLMGVLAPMTQDADVVFLESTPDDIQQMQLDLQKLPELTFITEGPTLIDRLPADDWAVLAHKAEAAGIPPWMAAKMRPWFLATALSLPPCLRDGQNVELGLDKRIARVAQQANVPLASLEDALEVIRMMNEDPLDVQLRQMRPQIALIGGGGEGADNITTMLAAYFDERVAEFLALTHAEFLTSGTLPKEDAEKIWDGFMDRLLRQRNEAWMPVIEAQEGNNIVIAVGALHLSGEHGLLKLLQDSGYTIERMHYAEIQ